MSAAVLVAGPDEVAEERMGLERLGFEFGMKLAREEEGMGGYLDDLDVGGIRGGTRDAETSAGKDRLILAVEFVAVAVAF